MTMDTTRTSGAEWPVDIQAPEPVKKWLEALFPLLDSKEPDVPERAAAMYTADAEVHGAAGVAKGTEAIIAARKNSWAIMQERRHELLRVFTSKQDFSDLLLVCKLTAKLKNGNEVSGEFISRLVFHGNTHVDPKGSLYTIWNDTAPWLKAMGFKIEPPS